MDNFGHVNLGFDIVRTISSRVEVVHHYEQINEMLQWKNSSCFFLLNVSAYVVGSESHEGNGGVELDGADGGGKQSREE